MATLTAVKFPNIDGARAVLDTLQELQKQQLITIHDAAIVQWPSDKRKPKTEQLHNMAGVGALSGAFWGMLFGLLFFAPLLGAAVGAAMGGLTGSLTDVGIDDDFINQIREQVTPGPSALFLLTSNAVNARRLGPVRDVRLQPDRAGRAQPHRLVDLPARSAGAAAPPRPDGAATGDACNAATATTRRAAVRAGGRHQPSRGSRCLL